MNKVYTDRNLNDELYSETYRDFKPKFDIYFELLGTIDELNSALGFPKLFNDELKPIIDYIQKTNMSICGSIVISAPIDDILIKKIEWQKIYF